MMTGITPKNYLSFKPSEFINSYKSDFKLFKHLKLHKLKWDIFDVGQISIQPFLNEPKNLEEFETQVSESGYGDLMYRIEMFFYSIGLGSKNCEQELSKLHPDLPTFTLHKIGKYIGSFPYTSTSVNIDVKYTESIMKERINHIVKILKQDGF